LAREVGKYPRLKFEAYADYAGQERDLPYTSPVYYEELRKSAPADWRVVGGSYGDWLLLHDTDGVEKVGIVEHETGLEIVLVAGSIAAFVKVVSYIWDHHKKLIDDHKGIVGNPDVSMTLVITARCP